MYRLHTQCRACGYAAAPYPGKSAPSGERLLPVFSLGVQPLANDFCDATEARSGFAPLEILLCPRCSLAQLSVVVDPAVLYSKYHYVTSRSDTMRAHFEQLWQALKGLSSCRRVVEIGSNDGLFLEFCKKNGAERVLGVDPAVNLAKVAATRGVDTIASTFNSEAARSIESALPQPNLIVARHVFCHVDNWKEFIRNLAAIAGQNTVVYLEVPYALDMLANQEFDTIYHEHTSYLTVRAMQALLKGSPLDLRRAYRFPIHGGSIGLILGVGKGNDGAFIAQLAKEEGSHDDMLARWSALDGSFSGKKAILKRMVEAAVEQGKTVVGYGASAKSTVWVNACGFTKRHLRFICDNTPGKQYKFSPGTDIPIVDEGALTRELPDLAICFAWNFFDEIYQKEGLFRAKGGKWIVPHPHIRIT